MELKDAIAHEREVAKNWKSEVVNCVSEEGRNTCLKRASESEQRAEWFEELAERRETDRWIPVSERLPENECDVLITIQYGKERCVIKGYYSHTDKVWENVNRIPVGNKKVIAWKPLPEPYENEA